MTGEQRQFTLAEAEQLGNALMPSFRLAMRDELQPVHARLDEHKQELTKLRGRASLWGAVTGVLSAIGLHLGMR